MRKRIGLSLFLYLTVVLVTLPGSPEKDLKVSLEERQVQDLSPAGLTLVFYVKILNSSDSEYFLSGYDYRFVVDQTEYIKLAVPLEEGIRIPSSDQTLLSFPLKITYEHLFEAMPGIAERDKVQCYLAGMLVFSDGRKERGRLPIAFSGEFPVFKQPDMEFQTVRINDLTLGGADIHFEILFRNRNGFELLIDTIDYTLELGGYMINEGSISGDKDLKSLEEKTYSLPFLLNFFEVGKGVSDVLHQTSTLCHFWGEYKIRTAWGRLTIPFDKKNDITITRSP